MGYNKGHNNKFTSGGRGGASGVFSSHPFCPFDFCSHQTCSMGSKYTKHALQPIPGQSQAHFDVFRSHGSCLVAANVELFMLSDLKVKANVVVSDCIICHRVVAY